MKVEDFLKDSRFPLEWQMGVSERHVFISILEKLQPELALEIGSYRGGSLQVISAYSKKVIAIDINPENANRLSGQFRNVEFLIGNSSQILPVLVSDMNESGKTPEFILVDGGHDEAQVKQDLNQLLKIEPTRELIIVCHDSFNPGCRKGIVEADWKSSPYVHEVEIDFVPGDFFEENFDTAQEGEMWGGFAIAILSPTKSTAPPKIRQSGRTIFEATQQRSRHRITDS